MDDAIGMKESCNSCVVAGAVRSIIKERKRTPCSDCQTVDQFKSHLRSYLLKKTVLCKLNALLVLVNYIMYNMYMLIGDFINF